MCCRALAERFMKISLDFHRVSTVNRVNRLLQIAETMWSRARTLPFILFILLLLSAQADAAGVTYE
jgi:hypothetical protein